MGLGGLVLGSWALGLWGCPAVRDMRFREESLMRLRGHFARFLALRNRLGRGPLGNQKTLKEESKGI